MFFGLSLKQFGCYYCQLAAHMPLNSWHDTLIQGFCPGWHEGAGDSRYMWESVVLSNTFSLVPRPRPPGLVTYCTTPGKLNIPVEALNIWFVSILVNVAVGMLILPPKVCYTRNSVQRPDLLGIGRISATSMSSHPAPWSWVGPVVEGGVGP